MRHQTALYLILSINTNISGALAIKLRHFSYNAATNDTITIVKNG